jgi:hypothetical protein
MTLAARVVTAVASQVEHADVDTDVRVLLLGQSGRYERQGGMEAPLTHEARQRREAEVMGDLLAVERDEAALMWRAMAERLPVEHRPDVNPVALLGLRLVATAHITSSETSPEHAMISFAGR